jgi:activator of HSP90 ATPase
MTSEGTSPTVVVRTSTRRQVISGVAVAFGALAAGSVVLGKTPPQDMKSQDMKEAPSTAANAARTSLHQEVDFKASPQRIYEILLDAKQFAAFTGMTAEIDPKAGGAFSTFNGMIEGRNIELVPAQRIVQAWRPTHWDAGIYSIVKFELKARGSGVTVVLDHSSFPAGDFDHLDPGWKLRYWDPLKKYLG